MRPRPLCAVRTAPLTAHGQPCRPDPPTHPRGADCRHARPACPALAARPPANCCHRRLRRYDQTATRAQGPHLLHERGVPIAPLPASTAWRDDPQSAAPVHAEPHRRPRMPARQARWQCVPLRHPMRTACSPKRKHDPAQCLSPPHPAAARCSQCAPPPDQPMPRPDPRFRRAHARRCSPSHNHGQHVPPVQMHQCGTAQHPCVPRSTNRHRPLAQTQTPPRAPEPMIAALLPIRNYPSLHRELGQRSMPADVQRHESLQALQAQSPARPSCPPHLDRWLVRRQWSATHGTIHADHARCQSDR